MAVNVGILGFAHGHVNAYCSRWNESPELGVHVIAGWDHDDHRAGIAKQTYGIDCESSVASLLSRADIDAVVIAAETAWHASLVEQAATAGKAIVLQKPIALTLADADRIIAAVNTADVPFTMAWQMRVDPHNLQIKALLESGRFGRVYMARRRHCLATQAMGNFDESWHVQPALNRDIFADDAAHPVDFLYWLLGMPVSVMAELGTLRNPKIFNDNGIAVFRYADGSFGEVSCSFAAVAGENAAEIICEQGSIILNYGDAVSSNMPAPVRGAQLKWFEQEAGVWEVSDIPEIYNQWERILGLAAPLAAFLRNERPPIATAEEGRDVLKLILACYASDAQGRRVSI